MGFLKKINAARRILFKRITKSITVTRFTNNVDKTVRPEIKRILIIRPNHRVGNLLLITPLLQEVITAFPGSKVDLFVKGNIAPVLFRNYPNIDKIIQLPRKPFKNLMKYIRGWLTLKKVNYDLLINVVDHSSSGKLSAKFANATYKFSGDINDDIRLQYKDHEHMAKYPVYGFRKYIQQLGYTTALQEIPSLDLKLSDAEIEDGKKILDGIVGNQKRTICLYTYATGDKCYPESWWETFYERLKAEYPDHNIIEVLPVENISKISFKAPCFYSKDLRQMGSLIANTEVFIGADSGIMHLASASQTPTVGLFSVTNEDTYKPYNNNSVAINTKATNIDDLIQAITYILLKNGEVTHAAKHSITT